MRFALAFAKVHRYATVGSGWSTRHHRRKGVIRLSLLIFWLTVGKRLEYRIFGKEKKLRRLTLLLAVLAAMMLVVSPVFAHPGGGTHGHKYANNYYPDDYFNYCHP